MPSLKSLAKDTAIYGLSSIVGRFLNYLLVPLYTHRLAAASGDNGVITNVYSYTALLLVILTFGMETSFFRFANKEGEDDRRVYATSLWAVGAVAAVFCMLVWLFLPQIAEPMGYAAHPDFIGVMAIVVAMDAFQSITFAYLRYQKKALKFAALKLLFIALNLALNCAYFLTVEHPDVAYVFYINLLCTATVQLCFWKELRAGFMRPDKAVFRRMLSYAWPLLILGIAGILNQTADKILYPLLRPGHQGQVELGIYGGCVKIAMIMALITQAFRYAYEPFVFGASKEKDNRTTYALAMKYFIIFTLLAFLCVVGYIDILKYLIGSDYWDGLRVVPIVMAAEIMMGIYFNLSFWYKLTDRTIWGAILSGIGCAVLIALNIALVPRYGYDASAWAGFAGYATAMTLSYIAGQHYYPIRYPLGSIMVYVVLCCGFYAAMRCLPADWPLAWRLGLNTLFILAYAAHVVYHEFYKKKHRAKA